MYQILLVEVLLINSIVAAPVFTQEIKEDKSETSPQLDWPVGDPRRCQRLKQVDVERFEVLPGVGWDNLRNLEAGLVVSYNYTQCKVTDDGNFLIPDYVFTIPIKHSRVERFAEFIDNWNSATSLTSKSVNIAAGMSLGIFSISGQYSSEHEELKSKQIEDNAATIRVQLRYPRYEAKLQPDAELSPQFKSRLLSIAVKIELNQTRQAEYEAQLLVRDFGTHVLSSVTAGAALVKDDYVKTDKMSSFADSKTAYLAAASASFLTLFQISSSYSSSYTDQQKESYSKATTHSVVKSYGGPLFDLGSTNLSAWTQGVDKNLVPMDRTGDPLNYLVKPQLLPDLPYSTVDALEKVIRRSIEMYYEMNTYRGCTKIGDPNFSYVANVDDGSCGAKATDLPFGGVYQTCSVYGSTLRKNPCDDLQHVNPKTGTYSCPPSYTAILIQTFYKRGIIETDRVCQSCGFLYLSTCCDNKQYESTAAYSAYWCAATSPVPPNSGYLFGGFYRPTQDNPLTGSTNCPPTFYPRIILTDVTLCLSDDFEQSIRVAIPFGGFFSCKSGNPLAVYRQNSTKNELQSNMSQNIDGSTSYPMRCPDGYSQHLATIDSGCSINFCAKTGSMTKAPLPAIRRPPFMSKPDAIYNYEEKYIFNPQTLVWMKNEKATHYEETNNITVNTINDSHSKSLKGSSAVIKYTVTLTFTCLLVAVTLL
ncbi:macrophage-expressed gene 1 protein-like [Biomphalaria glabrata]|uniref:Macrophage-expressed gene 1 protein-like n=1 Tax=Biomphalaria glabrata TaxID=6526 RepID=A0A9W3A922_BIOGL|nr:macrophage-expressed gene 1 protein-like [Biomphalaria glabrata]